jgi:hypothetical protein
VIYYDHEARRQFASERVADLAQDARRLPASATDADAERSRSSFASRLIQQARQLREQALSRAPAFRA